MERLETGLDELRKDFTEHVSSSAKSTNAILIGIIMCFLTGVIGIYVSHNDQKLNTHAEMTIIVKEVAKAFKDSK